MSTFQLKGDIVSYKYDSSTTEPTTDFSGKINNNINSSGLPQIDSDYCINFQTEI